MDKDKVWFYFVTENYLLVSIVDLSVSKMKVPPLVSSTEIFLIVSTSDPTLGKLSFVG